MAEPSSSSDRRRCPARRRIVDRGDGHRDGDADPDAVAVVDLDLEAVRPWRWRPACRCRRRRCRRPAVPLAGARLIAQVRVSPSTSAGDELDRAGGVLAVVRHWAGTAGASLNGTTMRVMSRCRRRRGRRSPGPRRSVPLASAFGTKVQAPAVSQAGCRSRAGSGPCRSAGHRRRPAETRRERPGRVLEPDDRGVVDHRSGVVDRGHVDRDRRGGRGGAVAHVDREGVRAGEAGGRACRCTRRRCRRPCRRWPSGSRA